jgi:DNA-directed RNA polymerase beta' subunit
MGLSVGIGWINWLSFFCFVFLVVYILDYPFVSTFETNAAIVMQPIELWTGKQLFSVLLRPHANVRVYVNLILKEKNYSRPNKEHKKERETMCPNDGYVYFRNSELISGQLGKATLGEFFLVHFRF